jgi:hypothetical protein
MILENSAIFVAFANVCSHSVRAKLWPNLWPENDPGVQSGAEARWLSGRT